MVKPSPTPKPTLHTSVRPCVSRAAQRHPQEGPPSLTDRLAVGLVGFAAVLSLSVAHPADAAGPFLKSTGARGPLAEEEAELYSLRQMEEGKVREELAFLTEEFEEETERSKENKFCATPFGIDVVGITEFIALTGALVGGVSARRRKDELEKLNEQLRTINTQLRQQARAGTIFAPGLTYVPPSSSGNDGNRSTILSLPSGALRLPPSTTTTTPGGATKPASSDPQVPGSSEAAPGSPPGSTIGLISLDEEDMRPEVKQCQNALKEGKKLLKDSAAGPAMVRVEKALMLAKSIGDRVRERRAVRGLAAASRLSGQNRQAIKYLERVLEISGIVGDHVGDADAYGVIADIYTDIGEFEKAAEFYDKYIGQMTSEDGPV